jgi:hypothetical protein
LIQLQGTRQRREEKEDKVDATRHPGNIQRYKQQINYRVIELEKTGY